MRQRATAERVGADHVLSGYAALTRPTKLRHVQGSVQECKKGMALKHAIPFSFEANVHEACGAVYMLARLVHMLHGGCR